MYSLHAELIADESHFSKRTKKAENLNPLKQMCCTKHTVLHCKSEFIEPCYTFFNGKRIIEHIYSQNLVQHEAFRHYSANFDSIIQMIESSSAQCCISSIENYAHSTLAIMNAYEPTTAS